MELTPFDYEILNFVAQFDLVDKAEIIDKFASRTDNLEYRLRLLSKPEYSKIPRAGFRIPNTSYIQEMFDIVSDDEGIPHTVTKNQFCITDMGKKALQDYQLKLCSESKKQRNDLIIRLLPIAISLLALIKSCWPEITSALQHIMRLLK